MVVFSLNLPESFAICMYIMETNKSHITISINTESLNETFQISPKTIQHATRIAITEDRPILWDYMIGSLHNESHIGVRRTKLPDGTFKETGEKILVKSTDEYTSNITKTFKCDNEYIILTENSIYIVSTSISTVYIS
jgi:hypothetical protein